MPPWVGVFGWIDMAEIFLPHHMGGLGTLVTPCVARAEFFIFPYGWVCLDGLILLKFFLPHHMGGLATLVTPCVARAEFFIFPCGWVCLDGLIWLKFFGLTIWGD